MDTRTADTSLPTPATAPTKGSGKQYFAALDGLRGIAAFSVLFGHSGARLPHYCLSVDLFFGLSGFVLASAYQDKLQNGMKLAKFMKLRLIRLYPLIFIGVILGIVGFHKVYDLQTTVVIVVTGFLLIPTSLGALSEDIPALAANPPSWSLTFELAINLFYAIIAPRLSNLVLLMILVPSGIVFTYNIAIHGDANLGGSWLDVGSGMPRVLFSFFYGILMFRVWTSGRWLDGLTPPTIVVLLVLVSVMAVPQLGTWNWIYEAGCIGVVFPALLLSGARALPSRWDKLCIFLGKLSYPIYILQGGIVIHIRALPSHLGVTTTPLLAFMVIAIAITFFTIFAWAVNEFYNEPIRRYMTYSSRGLASRNTASG